MKLKLFTFAVVLLASGSLFASVTEEETFSFVLDDGGRFSVSNVNGSITVTGAGGNSVEIIAIKKPGTRRIWMRSKLKFPTRPARLKLKLNLGILTAGIPLVAPAARSGTK